MAKKTPCIVWTFGLRSLTPIAYYYDSMSEARREHTSDNCFGDCWRFIKNPSTELIDKVRATHTL